GGEVARIGAEMASGLDQIHRAGFVHRDLKPANVMLDRLTGRPKIIDPGLARLAGCPRDKDGPGRGIAGTPAFMSPEQTRGAPLGPQSDLFNPGTILYALASGLMPFGGRSVFEVWMQIVHHEPEAVDLLRPGLPPGLSELIADLLRKDPADRPETAADVALR